MAAVDFVPNTAITSVESGLELSRNICRVLLKKAQTKRRPKGDSRTDEEIDRDIESAMEVSPSHFDGECYNIFPRTNNWWLYTPKGARLAEDHWRLVLRYESREEAEEIALQFGTIVVTS